MTRLPLRTALGAAGLGIAAYGAMAARGWLRYGHASAAAADERDEILDRFIPSYDIVERHHIRVAAPAAVTFAAAKDQDLLGSLAIRAIFRAREIVLGSSSESRSRPRALIADVQSLGWGVLAEHPAREIVMGAVTKPWEANVTFRALEPDRFAAFNEPGFVKIAWTLRADPLGPRDSMFRTETRAVATDEDARRRFRQYWAFVSPGIAAIRWLSLRPLKREAERRAADRPPLQAVWP